jgi:hypothetical protein
MASLREEEMLNQTTSSEESVETNEQSVIAQESAPAVNPHTVRHAYSLIENEGKYHVISVEFDPNQLVAGKVKKVESHTEKFIMQERLQVLMLGDDLI